MIYLKQIKSGYLDNFTYIIANPLEGIGTVIDPGWPGHEVDSLISKAAADDVAIKYIIATHCHSDHIGGTGDLIEKTGAELLVHEDEAPCMERLSFRPDIIVKNGDLLSLGGLSVRFIHTPGHSPGSMLVFTDGKVFTGDTLFVGGCGRADLPGSNPEDLYKSLFEKLLLLPDSTEIYPGHDYGSSPSSTIAREKKENPYLRCESREAFIKLRMGR
ncbi:MAG: MBL fold metallo-hydrolase [Deltaproteobacteria bacterium]|nr:MBL fold metallo-hydrolase [Deltaproteobacteria bacterium]